MDHNHYGTLRDYRFADKDIDDIRGSNIYGIDDEKLGDIDDVIFDHATGDIQYVVIDSGGWLSSKKFLVPAARLRPSQKHDNDYQVDMTKKQIEQFPPYDEKAVADRERWKEYDDRYQKMMTDGEIMHRKDSPDRIITPPTSEVAAAPVSSSRTQLGPRWNRFENGVRRDRVQIASTCNVCKFTPESSSTLERDRARKIS
jgi:sporulation protein YlmC with PRC-barrel domain